MRRTLAISAATFLTLSLSGAALPTQEDDACADAVAVLNEATVDLNAAVESDNLAAVADVNVEAEEFNDLLVGDLADIDALTEPIAQAEIEAVRADLEALVEADADLEAEVDVALTALDEVEVALDADITAAETDQDALRVNFDGAVAAANAACVDDPDVTVNNDNTVVVEASPVVEVPGKNSQVREVPRGGVATGDGSSL